MSWALCVTILAALNDTNSTSRAPTSVVTLDTHTHQAPGDGWTSEHRDPPDGPVDAILRDPPLPEEDISLSSFTRFSQAHGLLYITMYKAYKYVTNVPFFGHLRKKVWYPSQENENKIVEFLDADGDVVGDRVGRKVDVQS
mgnify:CR=1 FL=1